jgi:hypothetical protein
MLKNLLRLSTLAHPKVKSPTRRECGQWRAAVLPWHSNHPSWRRAVPPAPARRSFVGPISTELFVRLMPRLTYALSEIAARTEILEVRCSRWERTWSSSTLPTQTALRGCVGWWRIVRSMRETATSGAIRMLKVFRRP